MVLWDKLLLCHSRSLQIIFSATLLAYMLYICTSTAVAHSGGGQHYNVQQTYNRVKCSRVWGFCSECASEFCRFLYLKWWGRGGASWPGSQPQHSPRPHLEDACGASVSVGQGPPKGQEVVWLQWEARRPSLSPSSSSP